MDFKVSIVRVVLVALPLLVSSGMARAEPPRRATPTPAPASHLRPRLDQLNADLAAVSDQSHAQALGILPGLPNQVYYPISPFTKAEAQLFFPFSVRR